MSTFIYIYAFTIRYKSIDSPKLITIISYTLTVRMVRAIPNP